MNTILHTAFFSALLAAGTAAQGLDILYTVSTPETTITGSGGTVLASIRPNDIVGLRATPCPVTAEKWAPRQAFEVMAGDEDGDDIYRRPNLFGAIDALVKVPDPVAADNWRTLYYSPAAAMGTTVSGGPGLRPGDIGRVRRTGAGNGKVEHFIRAEDIQVALGLPPSPVVIDVDAACFGHNYGLFLSLDDDVLCNPCGGPTVMRDGDVFVLPPGSYTLTGNGTIAGTLPGSAVRIYTEANMDAMVANAQVTDRFGACVPNAVDVESLEIDWANPSAFAFPSCGGVVFVPRFLFSTETLTGGAVLTTALGGSIYNSSCSPLGTSCGSGPTLGDQIGLKPISFTTGMIGIASHVNALALTYIFEFAAEAATPQVPVGSTATIDFVTPPSAWVWVFMTFAANGPGAVPTSAPFPWSFLGFPEFYPTPNFMSLVPGGTGYATYTTPPIPWPVDLVFQGVTILPSLSSIELSTPTFVEVN